MSKIRKPSVSSKDNAEAIRRNAQKFQPEITSEERSRRGSGRDSRRALPVTIGARAQVQGLYTSNTAPEIPLPLGSLTYLDKKQYIHNMEIISHLSGATISGGEPLMAMWAKGKQRLLPAGGDFIDVSEAKNPVALNKKRVIQGGGAVVYNTKLKKWIMMCTAAQPLTSANPSISARPV